MKRQFEVHTIYELDDYLDDMTDRERAKAEKEALWMQMKNWDIKPEIKELTVTAKTLPDEN